MTTWTVIDFFLWPAVQTVCWGAVIYAQHRNNKMMDKLLAFQFEFGVVCGTLALRAAPDLTDAQLIEAAGIARDEIRKKFSTAKMEGWS